MKKSVLVLALVSLAGIPLAGCGTLRGGRSVVKHDKQDTALIMTKAPSSGTYALYSTMDWHPKGRFTVKEGDPIGFKGGGETARITAVAGQEEISLPTSSTYYWKKVD